MATPTKVVIQTEEKVPLGSTLNHKIVTGTSLKERSSSKVAICPPQKLGTPNNKLVTPAKQQLLDQDQMLTPEGSPNRKLMTPTRRRLLSQNQTLSAGTLMDIQNTKLTTPSK